MFIRITKQDGKALHLAKKSIVSFEEIFEESEGKRELKAIEISANNISFRVNGTPETLNELVTEIVRYDEREDDVLKPLIKTITSVVGQNARLASAVNDVQQRLAKIDGKQKPEKSEIELPQSTAEEKDENPVKAA